MPRNSLKVAEKLIVSDINATGLFSFSIIELKALLKKHRTKWGLSENIYGKRFIDFVIKNNILSKRTLKPEQGDERELFLIGNPTDYEIYTALRKSAYYTHYSALFLHGLTLQIPKAFYLNFEHSKPQSSAPATTLDQEAIDRAFATPQRQSRNYYAYQGARIYLLNGKFTGRLGLVPQTGDNPQYYYTDLERTLLDCTIRPAYSGGIYEVLDAYTNATDKLDIDKLYRYITQLEYIYPYEQAVGFYLERAGVPASRLDIFRKRMEYDFYLTHNIKLKEYSKDWRLFYPSNF